MNEERNEVMEVNEQDIDVIEESTDVVATDEVDETEECEGGSLKPLAIGAAVVGLAAIAIYKNRHKIAEWRKRRAIRKVEKLGYVVSDPEEAELLDDLDEYDDDLCESISSDEAEE